MYEPTCARCNVRYNPAESAGRWDCRRHGVEGPAYDPRCGEYVYECCGLCPTLHQFVRANWHSLGNCAVASDLQGCIPCDHTEEGVTAPATVALRTEHARHARADAVERVIASASALDPDPAVARVVLDTYSDRDFQLRTVGHDEQRYHRELVPEARRQRVVARRNLGALGLMHGITDDSDAAADAKDLVANYWQHLAPPTKRPPVSVTVLRREAPGPDPAVVQRASALRVLMVQVPADA